MQKTGLEQNIVHTGVTGLDELLGGGLPRGTTTILEGNPGTGKTTLGIQFLLEGARQYGESGIYITFEELPEQIYRDMSGFGWDLKELERQNKLRIICLEPDVLLDQMMRTDGLFEQLIREIDCKRVVIDSISLFRTLGGMQTDGREQIYSIRNIMRKFELTALFLREYGEWEGRSTPFENYVCDGIIRLSLREHLEKFRKRTVEILKMRGAHIVEGEHHYRFLSDGICILPALSMVEDKILNDGVERLSTGIPSLDDLLQGGLSKGSAFMVDSNSKANYKYLVTSMYAERLKQGDCVIFMLSGLTSVDVLEQTLTLFGASLEEAAREERVFFIDHYRRPVKPEFEKWMIYADRLSNEEYQKKVYESIYPYFRESSLKGRRWFIHYDLNTIISEHGREFVKRHFADEMARCRANGVTVLCQCNFTEIGLETASFLERASNGVIRTWVDGSYQYLQITKSPGGRMSAPHIVDNIRDRPYVRLI
ncbi:ATPase domain-containing protein [Saccharibacillus sp. CPCC 101409]|uniref:ATPase domain-containing protein n=1 Tax=Saccharibacillus sp. CPCC 101409 TaxID=3058041 RepID=UPI00267157A8|nr:ATPase domain-containing protein [Saccharibacillus sp. CPCC 101409]MDO3410094.1 ATPase domain-containing protein [Saccharibacillus sp. CPCC 101409]